MSSSSLLPICFACAHMRGIVPDVGWACEAFPDGIPSEVLASVKDHREPVDGDGGIRFEPKEGVKDEFRETDHPRDHGKFTSGGGSSGSTRSASEVKKMLSDLPRVPEKDRWLHHSQTSAYTSDPDEVYTRDLPGIKMATRENVPIAQRAHRGQQSYKKTELQRIDLSKVHFTQGQVNPGKLEHFVEHYHPKASDFNQHDEDASGKYGEAPHVSVYPDGSAVTSDHHRLIASILRGDKTAIARVTTWDEDKNGDFVQVKSKKGKDLDRKEAQDVALKIATDPPVSEAQRRAMWAAAAGHSTSGIPQSVGKEFANADPGGKLPARAKDMAPGKWSTLKRLFGEWISEEEGEAEHQGEDGFEEGKHPRGEGGKFSTAANQGPNYHVAESAPSMRGRHHALSKHGFGMTSNASVGGKVTGQSYGKTQITNSGPERHEVTLRHTGEWKHSGAREDPNERSGYQARREYGSGTGQESLKSHLAKHFPIARDVAAWDSWDRKGRAASVAFVTQDGKVLLLKRAKDETNWPDTWSFPGGKAEDGEEFEDCARREAVEECGDCGFDGMAELERTRTPNDFEHATYVVPVQSEFTPKLSPEHQGWAWYAATDLPDPVHPGVRAAIDRVINPDGESEEARERATGKLSEREREAANPHARARADKPKDVFLEPDEEKYPVKVERDGEWKYDRGLLLAAAREARMHGHEDLAKRADEIREREFSSAHDMAIDWDVVSWSRTASLNDNVATNEHGIVSLPLSYAFDRGSVRDVDPDSGRMNVSEANISKANVCPYYGEEIPDFERLGLDPKRKYMLLRHPDELKRAVSSFNNLPVLSDHVPVTSDNFPQDKIIGSTGTDAEFREPYLKNSLVFWPKEAIDDIESNAKKQLSAGYRYRADMTPGTYKGVHYDGVMRDIKGNHMALVREGRAGADVVVGDSALGGDEEEDMTVMTPKANLATNVFVGHFAPKFKGGLALDSAITLFRPIFSGVTTKNFGTQRPALDAALRIMLKDRLASDADIGEVTELLKQIEGVEAGADDDMEANAGLPSYMQEEPEDADDETPEEREEDEAADRRASDFRSRHGRDMRAEDEESEAEREDPEEGRRPGAEDRKRARDKRRADDARARLGHDESEEERKEREAQEAAEDRVHARDRRRLGRDYRSARDAHKRALDALRKHASDWKAARDGHRKAMDSRNADDAARHARDMKRADDEAKECMDALKRARDARHRARDARRAHDKRHGMDAPPEFKGMPKPGMDEASVKREVEAAIAANDQKHRDIAGALSYVRPKAGEIAMDSKINSAADVYGKALDVLGVEHVGIKDALALRRMYDLAPRVGGETRPGGFAQDSALSGGAAASFASRYPTAAKIERV